MTQTVPATAVLGPGKTGLAIGLRVLNLDGTEYAAFATTDVAETSVAGTYRKAGGVVVPDAGGYIVWGVSGTDYAEATVESTAVNVTMQAGVAVAAADANGNVPVDVASISGDTAAADNLEAMLDGTRAKLYLSGLDIVAAGNDSAIKATGSGAGHGIDIDAGATGRGIDILTTDGIGVMIDAAGAGKHGLYVRALGASSRAIYVYGASAGVRIEGGTDMAMHLLTGTGAATLYVDGPGGGGSAIAISSSSVSGGDENTSEAIFFDLYQGHPAVRTRWPATPETEPGKFIVIENGEILGTTSIDAVLASLARTGADGDTLETLSDQIDGVLEDTGTTLPGLIAASAAGSGAISFPVTVNDEDSNPIDGVEVWISTDSAGASVVAGTLSTDALGLATFMLDAGTYYLWRQKSGYNFANPVTIVVS